MPNLFIVQQIRRNTNRVFACLQRTITRSWQCINKYSTKFANAFNKQIVGRITRKANKHKKCLKITCIILAILGLITGLFMGSFKSAGAREQGLEINYTEGVLKQKYYTNDWKYTGLNGYMQVVPKQKILIQFNKNASPPDTQSKTRQIYGPIQTRVAEGTKLLIQGSFQCSIIILDNKDTNMKLFFQTYGFDKTPGKSSQFQWMTYLRQQIFITIVKKKDHQYDNPVNSQTKFLQYNKYGYEKYIKYAICSVVFAIQYYFSIQNICAIINYQLSTKFIFSQQHIGDTITQGKIAFESVEQSI